MGLAFLLLAGAFETHYKNIIFLTAPQSLCILYVQGHAGRDCALGILMDFLLRKVDK